MKLRTFILVLALAAGIMAVGYALSPKTIPVVTAPAVEATSETTSAPAEGEPAAAAETPTEEQTAPAVEDEAPQE